MIRPFELFVSLRYTRAKRRNRFISFISAVSMLGIALGVAVLVTVLSVMNGFEEELKKRILTMTSHITLTAYNDNVLDWQGVIQDLRKIKGVKTVTPFISGPGMTTQGRGIGAVHLRGVNPESEGLAGVKNKMVVGKLLELAPGNIIIGKVLAEKLKVKVGDSITVITSQDTFRSHNILPKFNRFKISGIFSIGMYEYDKRVTLIHYEDAAKILRGTSGVSGLGVNIADPLKATEFAERLNNEFSAEFYIRDWTTRHQNFFRALKQQKGMMFIILSAILGLAAFSIISTLIIVVSEKRSDIAVLRTLGATPRSILAIFSYQGCIIGVVGTLLGLIGGVVLAQNVELFVSSLEGILGIQLMPADVYFISELTSELNWHDLLQIAMISFLLSYLATIYPAGRAAYTKPAKALRYE